MEIPKIAELQLPILKMLGNDKIMTSHEIFRKIFESINNREDVNIKEVNKISTILKNRIYCTVSRLRVTGLVEKGGDKFYFRTELGDTFVEQPNEMIELVKIKIQERKKEIKNLQEYTQ